MKVCLLFIFFFAYYAIQAQRPADTCKTNIDLAVSIDTSYAKEDTSSKKINEYPGFLTDYVRGCNPCYTLQPLNNKFTVVSFRILVETQNDEMMEGIAEGNSLSSGRGRLIFMYATAGNRCISTAFMPGMKMVMYMF